MRSTINPCLRVTSVTFTDAPPDHVAKGLLGWVSVEIDGALQIDGVTVRQTWDRRLALSFPERRSGSGRRYALVRPIGDAARRSIERQVFEMLDLEQEADS